MNETNENDENTAEELDSEVEIEITTEVATRIQETLNKIKKNSKAKKMIAELEKEIKGFNLEELLESDEKLLSEAISAKKERDEYLALLQRFKADFENYKKRAQKQEETNVRVSSEKILTKIFPPIEDLKRAIKFSEENNQNTVPLEGISIIHNKLQRVMEDEGVMLIDPHCGEAFDPKFHEAIVVDESGTYETDQIVKSYEMGYKIKDRVIRAAKVMVAIDKEEEKEESEINCKNNSDGE
ncbi:MAG TPA: nucleotide exchange factor GrpE [candidate division Zixibacteria bacterium]|nr:nucleotide exchange factor GrpE [candidate division Zixibacteria bacterium]